MSLNIQRIQHLWTLNGNFHYIVRMDNINELIGHNKIVCCCFAESKTARVAASVLEASSAVMRGISSPLKPPKKAKNGGKKEF
jgi:hypothetical protein